MGWTAQPFGLGWPNNAAWVGGSPLPESSIGLQAIAQWAAVQPALANSPVPQGLGTGGLFTNNIPGNLTIEQGTLLTASQTAREESTWRQALEGAVRHQPGCEGGVNHDTP